MKRVISLFIVMLIMSSAVYAQGILNSGTIDGMINWTVYNDGKLTIEGSGAIADYSSSSSVPWYQNRNAITSLELNGSITLIGKYAFYACTNITDYHNRHAASDADEHHVQQQPSVINNAIRTIDVYDRISEC